MARPKVEMKQLKKSISFRFEVHFCHSELSLMVYSAEIPELVVVEPSNLHSTTSGITSLGLETVYLK